MSDVPVYLTTGAAGHSLGLSGHMVRSLVRTGELPVAGKIESGILLFRPEDVASLAARRASGLRRKPGRPRREVI